MDGVLVIAPTGELLGDLRRTCGIGAMEVTGIMSAVRGVFSRLDPALKVSGATLGSFVNSDPVERGDKVRLMFDGTEVRIVDCLNAIARQANVAWIVVTSDDKPEPKLVKAGVIRARGTSTFVDIHTPNPK